MKFPRRRFIGVFLAFILIWTLSACGSTDRGAGRTIRIELGQAPATVDPSLVQSDCEQTLAYALFEGLMRTSADGKSSPAAAESVSVDDSGLVHTFTLRPNVWSDGEPVRAQDFVFGLHRAVDPVTRAKGVADLYCIQNARAIAEGSLPTQQLGVEAVDDRTLVIRLETPCDSLYALLSSPLTFPCREDVFLQAAGRYGMTAKTTVCNGPFTLRRWPDKANLTLAKNNRYRGNRPARASGIVMTFSSSEEDRMERLQRREVDLVAPVNNQASLPEGTALHYDFDTGYTLFLNPRHPVLQSKSARSALMGIVNPSSYAAWGGGYQLSAGLIPESCTVGNLSYRTAAGAVSPLQADLEQAKADYAAAVQSKEAKNAPKLTLLYPQDDTLQSLVGHLAQTWQKELGAYISPVAVSTAELRSAVASGNYQLVLFPLQADDHRALTLLRSLESSGLALPKDTAAAWQDLLTQAEATQADAQRAKLLHQAESLLVGEAVALPVADRARCYAARDVINGVTFAFSSRAMDLALLGKTGD